MGLRRKGSSTVDDIYFLVKEDHCLGHFEPRTLTVREYRTEQGIDVYDDMNREWREIVLKKRSSGPTIGRPSPKSFHLFFLASYDIEGFRDFTLSENFQEVFDLDTESLERLRTDDEALLKFAFRFLKQVLFGEMSIPRKQEGIEKRRTRRLERLRAAMSAGNAAVDMRDDLAEDD
jgi:hypothetical protein